MELPNNLPKDYTGALVWCEDSYTALPIAPGLFLLKHGENTFSITGYNRVDKLAKYVAMITDFLLAHMNDKQRASDMASCGMNLYVDGKQEFSISVLFVYNTVKCIAHLLATLIMDLSALYKYKPQVKYLAVSLDCVRPDSNSVDIVIRWFAAEYAFALAFTKDGEEYAFARSAHLDNHGYYPKAYLDREISARGKVIDGKHSFGVVKDGLLLLFNGVREFRASPWYYLTLVRDDDLTGDTIDQLIHIGDDDKTF